MPPKAKGSSRPEVRRRMLEKAIELYMKGNFGNPYFTGQTPEVEELKASGYLNRAKILVPKEISQD